MVEDLLKRELPEIGTAIPGIINGPVYKRGGEGRSILRLIQDSEPVHDEIRGVRYEQSDSFVNPTAHGLNGHNSEYLHIKSNGFGCFSTYKAVLFHITFFRNN